MACNSCNSNGIWFPDFVSNACCNPCCSGSVGGTNTGCGCGSVGGTSTGCGCNSCSICNRYPMPTAAAAAVTDL